MHNFCWPGGFAPVRSIKPWSTAGLWMMGLTFLLLPAESSLATEGVNLRVRVGDEWLEGKALRWSSRSVKLLTRDGFLREIEPAAAKEYQRLAGPFRGLPAHQLRGQLIREFGKRFQVSGTGHYLVVHPAGERDKWARRFEDLYRSFMHYFSVRGLQPSPPEFPLVAIVFPDRRSYSSYNQSTGTMVPTSVLGYYSLVTNRIVLYDVTANRSGVPWYHNAETIIHEATHQTAFNTGIHSRFAQPPRWVTEGLAMMFEAKGVWDAHHHRDRASRINRGRLESFRTYLAKRKMGGLRSFILTDTMFQSNASAAYAEAWALSFYLAETRPQAYARYLRRTASHEPFTVVTSQQRWKDFSAEFGDNIDLLETHYLRFISQLR